MAPVIKSSSAKAKSARRPDYQRITRELRDEIISGKFAPGSRLPSTEALALRWRSNVYTVHTALAALAKEGWIERLHGAGTFVAEPHNRFTCAAIYHEADIGSNRESSFVRSIHDCLLEQLAARKKDSRIFMDSRPREKRGTLLPALAEAILNREVQCVIAPTATFFDSPALAKITLPAAFAGNPGSPNRVDFDKEEFLLEGVRCLAEQGCRSVGIITPYGGRDPRLEIGEYPFAEVFRRAVREAGLATRAEWLRTMPQKPDLTHERFGYREFRRLWALPKKPDGLLVFPDSIARGVITGVLREGVENVTARMKFVFHRNAHMDLLCPFPVTWGLSDENLLAVKMIEITEAQFRGEKVQPSLLPYQMKFDDARLQ